MKNKDQVEEAMAIGFAPTFLILFVTMYFNGVSLLDSFVFSVMGGVLWLLAIPAYVFWLSTYYQWVGYFVAGLFILSVVFAFLLSIEIIVSKLKSRNN